MSIVVCAYGKTFYQKFIQRKLTIINFFLKKDKTFYSKSDKKEGKEKKSKKDAGPLI